MRLELFPQSIKRTVLGWIEAHDGVSSLDERPVGAEVGDGQADGVDEDVLGGHVIEEVELQLGAPKLAVELGVRGCGR